MVLKSMLSLDDSIEKLAYVGPRNAPRLKRLGIKNVRDLLWHFPFRYEDFSQKIEIKNIREKGETVSIIGTVVDLKTSTSWKRRMTITDVTIEDETDSIHAIWFNQPYLERTLPIGVRVSVSGKVGLNKSGLYLSNPTYEKISDFDGLTHTGRLVPVYPETEGVSSKYLRMLIRKVLTQPMVMTDPLPDDIRSKNNFPELKIAIKQIHFPDDIQNAKLAKARFAFEEILFFQLRALRDRRILQDFKSPSVQFNKKLIGDFVKNLPFSLTNDQRIAAYEILKDLEKGYPMNRILNGDVGSGKTVVALMAAYEMTSVGYQAVFLAPTEILAKQHFDTIGKVFENHQSQLTVGLLTGSIARQFPTDEVTENEITKKLMREKIAKGEIKLIIGTHAVIQKDVKFRNLGLVIIDEQHRFGVEQRMKLIKNAENNGLRIIPHLLSMTATPIPRTLALTIYGDLDVSLLKEKPKGRREIITRVIPHSRRTDAYKFIASEVKNGRQVFVICPRIEVSKLSTTDQEMAGTKLIEKEMLTQAKLIWAEVKAVAEEYEKLSKTIFPDLKVAMLHGKLKPKEKEEIMAKFKNGHFDILVSTSVVEVGVDIPNAVIMMIESADRFGLAQLHQFRGRVGRGYHQSYCLLFCSDDSFGSKRLKALEKTNDGFALAEIDLKIRGPGEFTGVKQSGMPDLAMASLADIELIKKARQEAKQIINQDPFLKKHPAIASRLLTMEKLIHFE